MSTQKTKNNETAAAGFAICSPESAPGVPGKRPIQILGQCICKARNIMSDILSYAFKERILKGLQFFPTSF
jgi:hypothetical protein